MVKSGLKKVDKSQEKFDELYAGLNREQKRAVDAIEGPVMVVAGPGTGKTTLLTLRIANILRQTDVPPEAILALTFTESGAYAMRRKLVTIVGSAGYKVNIATFHGFCNGVIKEYPERFPRIIGSVAVADIDQIKLMEKIVEKTKLEMLRPYGDPLYYVKPALNAIRSLKREGHGPDDFGKSIWQQEKDFKLIPDLKHEKGAHKGKMKGEYIKLQEQIKKNHELLAVFQAYEKALADKKLYDYEDMIIEVIKALRADPDLLLILQENYQYILADEHQDANNAQNSVLELLASFHPDPNLFIVGDEKQAIYRFQGASLDNFLYFKKLYPKALLINLEQNYRSQQMILDASHSLIEKNPAPEAFRRVRLKSGAKTSDGEAHRSMPIRIAELATADLEHFFIAFEVKGKIADGVPAEEIAVLYRDNKDAFAIAGALSRAGVPCRVESDQDMLRDEQIRKLLMIFRGLHNLADDEALGKLLFVDFLGLDTLAVFKTIRKTYTERRPLHDLVKADFPEFAGKLSHWANAAKHKPFAEVFEIVVRESGFLADALKSQQSLDRLRVLEAFFAEVRKLSTGPKEYFLADFMEYLTLMEGHGILLRAAGLGAELSKSVRLMTAHKSKGLEFAHVYITGAYDGHWGNKRDRKNFHLPLLSGGATDGVEKNQDERRLFYVAITRAKESVTVTYAKTGADGREQIPSQFIEEIDPALREWVDTKKVSQAFASQPGASFAEKKIETASISDKKYIKEIFLEQGLAVTALNNYLACPWQYFFVNLIRVPQAKTKFQLYGTAAHETLRAFFNKYRESEDLTKKELLELFEYHLTKQPMNRHDFAELLAKGKESLGGYFDLYKKTWSRTLITEFDIRGVHLPVKNIGDIILKGKIDKLDILSDREVNVVDYKTGKPKSRNELEGKTKDADGDYKRQLVFYRLLLDLDEQKRYQMLSGELDFTEPDERGKYHKERFEIGEEEVAELKSLIGKVAGEITSLEFWNRTCKDKKCEWCPLAKVMNDK